MFPNPTNGILNFPINDLFLNSSGKLLGRIIDINGRTVKDFTLNFDNEQLLTLDLEHLDPGVYCLVVVDESNPALRINSNFIKK